MSVTVLYLGGGHFFGTQCIYTENLRNLFIPGLFKYSAAEYSK